MPKFRLFRPGLAPGPRWGAYDAPPDHLLGWGGDALPHSPPHSTPAASSSVGASGPQY